MPSEPIGPWTARGRRSIGGVSLLIVAVVFGIIAYGDHRKIAYVKSHSPVWAAIISKAEVERSGKKLRHTVALLDYERETPKGSVHCSISHNLPGWSPNYDPGRMIQIYPREDSCYEPYLDAGEQSPSPFFSAAIAFLMFLAASLMLWSRRY